ncbi:MAG: hypothetical protein AMS27_03795 [Bacteroides sp. SM23_62_1]|nr:MAG: hypothetical protein AMS27_03795 [Bacteroides sp. SM23_62_1]
MSSMKKILYKNILIIICYWLFTAGCHTGKEITKTESDRLKLTEAENKEYQYALTEATKYKIFGNLKQATALYEKCLQVNPLSDVAHYQLGAINMIMGNIENARIHTREALEINQENYWYLMQLAQIYNYQNKYDSLKYVYQKMIQYWPEKIEISYDLARIYSEEGQYEKALKILNKIEDENGISEPVSLLKEQIFVRSGKNNMAVEEIQKLIKLQPGEIRYLGILAELYNSMDENDKAKVVYEQIFNIDPENTLALLSYSEFLRETGDEDKQFEILKEVFNKSDVSLDQKLQVLIDYLTDQNKFDSQKSEIKELIDILLENYTDDYKVRTAHADYLVKIDEYKKALEEYDYVLSIEKGNYFIWEQSLYIENILGNLESLYTKSGEAIRYFPDKPVLYLFRGNAAMRLNKYEEANNVLEKGLAKVVNNNALKLQFYTFLAESYQSTGDNKKSDEYFELALTMDPNNLLLMNNYGYFLSLRAERLEYAEKMSRKTIEAEPENSTYLDTYAWIMFKSGNLRKAKEYIERAMKYGGKEDPEILEHYGDILEKMGQATDALKYWKLSIEKGNTSENIHEKILKAEKDE